MTDLPWLSGWKMQSFQLSICSRVRSQECWKFWGCVTKCLWKFANCCSVCVIFVHCFGTVCLAASWDSNRHQSLIERLTEMAPPIYLSPFVLFENPQFSLMPAHVGCHGKKKWSIISVFVHVLYFCHDGIEYNAVMIMFCNRTFSAADPRARTLFHPSLENGWHL